MSDLTLDELFAAAKKEYAKTLAAKSSTVKAVPESPRWVRGPNVRLLHKDTQAFLGDFSEWLSPKDGARKLTREADGAFPIDKVEWIAGDWGVNNPTVMEYVKLDQRRAVEIPLELEGSPSLLGKADVIVAFQDAAIVSASLVADTTFFDGAGQIFELPANFNVYPLLTRTSKIILFQEVRRQQEM